MADLGTVFLAPAPPAPLLVTGYSAAPTTVAPNYGAVQLAPTPPAPLLTTGYFIAGAMPCEECDDDPPIWGQLWPRGNP